MATHQGAPLGVAVIGAGYWGPNLARNFQASDSWHLRWLCDLDVERARSVLGRYSTVEVTADYAAVLADDTVDAVVIATPAATHATLALQALEAGKHVLVEKPLASSYADGEKMVPTRREPRAGPDVRPHVLLHVRGRSIRESIVDAGTLGDVQFFDSVRINLGLVQRDVDVLWDLAPHDLVDPRLRASRRRCARSRSPPHGADPIGAGVDVRRIPHAATAGRCDRARARQLAQPRSRCATTMVGGSKRTVMWDDLNLSQRITVFDKGVELTPREDLDLEDRRKAKISYRSGDIIAPALPEKEALRGMVEEFASAIREGRAPRTDGRSGLRVLDILEAASRSMEFHGSVVPLRTERPDDRRRPVGVALRSVTGGAGTIGTHVVDRLLDAGAREVVVLDNLRSWAKENLAGAMVDDRLTWSTATSATLPWSRISSSARTWCSTLPRFESRSAPRNPGWHTTCWRPEPSTSWRLRRQRESARSSPRRAHRCTGRRLTSRRPRTTTPGRTTRSTAPRRSTTKASCGRSTRCTDSTTWPCATSTCTGRRMDVHGLYTEVLIRWMERIEAGEPPLVLGDGLQTMDFVDVRDIANANLLAARAPATDRVYNVARGEETSLVELAGLLASAMGRDDLTPEHGPARKVNGVARRLASTHAAQRRLGFHGGDRPRARPTRPRRLVARGEGGRGSDLSREVHTAALYVVCALSSPSSRIASAASAARSICSGSSRRSAAE